MSNAAKGFSNIPVTSLSVLHNKIIFKSVSN